MHCDRLQWRSTLRLRYLSAPTRPRTVYRRTEVTHSRRSSGGYALRRNQDPSLSARRLQLPLGNA
ncbi:hypothetical protein B0H17DRAFT_1072717, partial [Mycena rosella]